MDDAPTIPPTLRVVDGAAETPGNGRPTAVRPEAVSEAVCAGAAVLGAVDALAGLDVGAFFDSTIGDVVRAARAVAEAGVHVDASTVLDEMRRLGVARRVDSRGGLAYLVGLASEVPALESVPYHASRVADWHAVRRTAELAAGIAASAQGSVADPRAWLLEHVTALRDVDLPVVGGGDLGFRVSPVAAISEISRQEWLIEGLIPRFPDDGCAGYMFGPAKARKSLMLADFALSVTTGTAVFNTFPVRHMGAAVGFFAEDPQSETSRRIHRLARGRNVQVPDNLYLIDIPCLDLCCATHQARLFATLRSIPDLAFVWLDPMVRLHRINDNHAEELGPLHTFLRTLARAIPRAVICIAHHANKEGGARGSTEYNAFGDYNLYLKKVDDQTTEFHELENRGGVPGRPFRVQVDDGSDGEAAYMNLRVVEREADDAGKLTAIEETIIAWRASNPGGSGRGCQEHLRSLGLKVTNDRFWDMFRNAKAR